jgi:hypothetical protein
MKLLAACTAVASLSLFACGASPDTSTSLASDESSLVAGGPDVTTQCQLRYEYKDCAGTICQRFVGDLEVMSQGFPSFEGNVGAHDHPYTASVSATPKRGAKAEGYFELAIVETSTGHRYASSGEVSLANLAPNGEVLGGDLLMKVEQFADHGSPYDLVELSCLIHATGTR